MSVDWGRLYTQGRCKAIGVSWSEIEAHAVFVLKVPADFVRRGCLTIDEYEKMKAKDEGLVEKTHKVQLLNLRRDQLAFLCEKEGQQITEAATKATLIELLLNLGYPKSIPIELLLNLGYPKSIPIEWLPQTA